MTTLLYGASSFYMRAYAADHAFFETISFSSLGIIEVVVFSALIGLLLSCLILSFVFIRQTKKTRRQTLRMIEDLEDRRIELEQLETLVTSDDEISIVYDAHEDRADIFGALGRVRGVPASPSDVLLFKNWLESDAVATLQNYIQDLKDKGPAFSFDCQTHQGNFLTIRGRAVGSKTVIRIKDLSGVQEQVALLNDQLSLMQKEVGAFKALGDILPEPLWLKNDDGKIIWANKALLERVGYENLDALHWHGRSFIQNQDLVDLDKSFSQGHSYRNRVDLIFNEKSQLYRLYGAAFKGVQALAGIDIEERERLKQELESTLNFHSRTLNQLNSAVAIFDENHRLIFHNPAYQDMFGLDKDFLAQMPEESRILDAMRAQRQLPEQADFKRWRKELFEAYRGSEDILEDSWHLPDGRTLRVVATPHPKGGVTWVYENVSEKLDLESRYNALTRAQNETLNALREGVAVFGSDGCLKILNPAVQKVWGFCEGALKDGLHAHDFVALCRDKANNDSECERILSGLTGVFEARGDISGRMTLKKGKVLDYVIVPLMNGANMITFADVTDSFEIERALNDRNEALEEATRLKSTFVEHVSYELRSPLTSVIGFAQLLGEKNTGALNEKQREYLDYILHSSAALLVLVNDILDLATIDAGIFSLELEPMDVATTIRRASEGLKDRLTEKHLSIQAHIDDDVEKMIGDEKRIRQILFNLLSNAVAFSKKGSSIDVAVKRDKGFYCFEVQDHGTGIDEDYLDTVFERFETRSENGGRAGSGLGLALVKAFVELHGGDVMIDNHDQQGVRVVFKIPEKHDIDHVA